MTSSSFATLPRTAGSSPRLRALLWTTFACWDCPPDRLDDATLVLSELVGNAVRHGTGERLRVRLRRRDDVLRISVRDASPVAPRPRMAADDEEGGRGLLIVAALSRDWGWEPTVGGKVVWADVDC